MELKNWWKLLLEPKAQALIEKGYYDDKGDYEGSDASCSVAHYLVKVPCISRFAKVLPLSAIVAAWCVL